MFPREYIHAVDFPKKSITEEYVGHNGFNRNADGIKSKQLHGLVYTEETRPRLVQTSGRVFCPTTDR